MRHAQHGLSFTGGIDQPVFEILPAIVHVRHDIDQIYCLMQRNAGIDAVRRIARRNHKLGVRGIGRENSLLRSLLCKNQPDAAAVDTGFAVGCVMQLENEV